MITVGSHLPFEPREQLLVHDASILIQDHGRSPSSWAHSALRRQKFFSDGGVAGTVKKSVSGTFLLKTLCKSVENGCGRFGKWLCARRRDVRPDGPVV